MGYGRYQDQLGQWNTDLNFANDRANGLYDRAYQQYADALAQSNYERDMAAKGINLENSRAYSSVLNNALQLSGDNLIKYLDAMVAGGYITPEEAAYIRDVELAGGLLGTAAAGSGKKSTGNGGDKQTKANAQRTDLDSNLGTSGVPMSAADLDYVDTLSPSEQKAFYADRKRMIAENPDAFGYTPEYTTTYDKETANEKGKVISKGSKRAGNMYR